VRGPEFDANWILLHLSHLSRIPSAIPNMTLWEIPASFDVPKFVYQTILSSGYIENIWPALKLVMGSSIDNFEWTAGVLTTLTLVNVLQELPYVDMEKI